MFKLSAPALLAALVLIPLTWGDDPPAQPKPAPTADQLVEQLGDRDFRKRDAAVKRLEALGPAALPALRKAEKHADPEIRRRVKRRAARNLRPDPRFRVERAPGYRPAEPLAEDEWPETLR